MKGLAEKTANIFDGISKMESIKPYTLVGGTALSLQIGARLSEDLDFMKWRKSAKEKPGVEWAKIEKELSTIGEVQNRDIYDIDHVEFLVGGVKVSFYSSPNYCPVKELINISNNLNVADPMSIGAMKMEVMLRRSKFRDYYDIYALLINGYDINEMIDLALSYSRHRLKTKNLLSMLTNGERFSLDRAFKDLEPIYDVSSEDIESLIRKNLIDGKKL